MVLPQWWGGGGGLVKAVPVYIASIVLWVHTQWSAMDLSGGACLYRMVIDARRCLHQESAWTPVNTYL